MRRYKLIIKLFLLMLAAVLSLAVSGCRNYVVQTGTLDEGYIPTPSGKIKLQYTMTVTEAEKRSINDWISVFNKKYDDVTVNVEFNVSRQALEAQISSKTVGDVFFLDETQVYNYAIVQKALMQLDYYVEAYGIDLANIFSAIMNMGVCEGKLYMVLRDYNHMLLHYNRDLIRAANLTDPVELEAQGEWTWETFKEYCRMLTTEEGSEDKVVGASLELGYAPISVMFLEGWGGKYYDTAQKKVYFKTDERVLQGINEMIGVVDENIVNYIPCEQTGTGARGVNTSSQARRDFSGYRSAFASLVFPSFGSIGKQYESKGIDWDIVSMPATPTHKVGTGATGFCVFNGTKYADAAAALALSLYTEEGQRAYNGQEGGSVPNVRSLADESFWRVPFTDNRDDPVSGKNYYAFISFPEADTYGRIECVLPPEIAKIVTGTLQNIVPDVINGTISADSALEKLEREANDMWETLYKN
ncbi:MAG: carbohydrate ABC transporter substrate-binding protein [Clostridia bacterium]|nr:carbohydrate ABC transporter substrate-binding protein [Clostridia bacterium]